MVRQVDAVIVKTRKHVFNTLYMCKRQFPGVSLSEKIVDGNPCPV